MGQTIADAQRKAPKEEKNPRTHNCEIKVWPTGVAVSPCLLHVMEEDHIVWRITEPNEGIEARIVLPDPEATNPGSELSVTPNQPREVVAAKAGDYAYTVSAWQGEFAPVSGMSVLIIGRGP